VPCPKPATLEAARQAGPARERQAARVEALVAAMPAALKADVMTLLREGRKIDAIRRYRDGASEDLTTAESVVDRLAASAGAN
jgi:hypothetical protein